MEALSSTDIFLFEGFHLDRRGLFRRDEGAALAPVEIGSRALDVLGVLLQKPGDLLSRDEIMAAAWPGTVVEDNNLTVQISTLRRVLDRDRAQGGYIQTVPGRGYRFVAPVRRIETDAHSAVQAISQGSGRSRPRLSIVVLPFTNLSDDREQQYFADGITDDLTTDLSRIPHMFVISRNTAFTYGYKPADAKQIGRDLSVRYVLEGSIRRSGNHVRVNAQLIDAEADAHLWAERFDRDMGDLFALQDEITRRIAVALHAELLNAEAARATDHPDVLDYILRARAIMWMQRSRDNYSKVVSLFERALALDTGSITARSELAVALANRVVDTRIGMTDSAAADAERANTLIAQVVAVSPLNPMAHFAKAQLLRAERRCEEAVPEYETAIASNRNNVAAYRNLGACKLLTGSIEESISLEEQAIRLSPRDPVLGVTYWRIGSAHLLQSRTDEAIAWLEKARSDEAGLAYVHAYLASAYALKGETLRAATELAEARKLSDGRYSSISRLKASEYFGVPMVRALFESTYFAGLRKAGMPED